VFFSEFLSLKYLFLFIKFHEKVETKKEGFDGMVIFQKSTMSFRELEMDLDIKKQEHKEGVLSFHLKPTKFEVS